MMKPKKQSKLDFKEFIRQWNIKYPYDRWWRKKYNVPFGSAPHLEQSHIYMSIEYREDIYFKQLADKSVVEEFNQEKATLISTITALGQEKLVKKQSKTVSDSEFNNIDLTQFNDIP